MRKIFASPAAAAQPTIAEMRHEPPPRSPEREALAAAIDQHAALSAHAAAVPAAISIAARQVWAAERAIHDAKQGIEAAKAANAHHLTATALGTAGDAPPTIKAARAALLDAEDALEAARSSRESLEGLRGQAASSADYAGYRVDSAVKAVIVSEIGGTMFDMIRRYQAMKTEMAALRRDIEFLLTSTETRQLGEGLWDWSNAARLEGGGPWRAWAEALKTDADAPMPGTPSPEPKRAA